MKRLTIRFVIAVSTFIIGIVAAAVWLSKPAPPLSRIQLAPTESELPSPSATPVGPDVPAPPVSKDNHDTTVYSVKLCDLVRESARYDGKLVRTQAFYNQGIDTSSLSDPTCEAWLRPYCAASDKLCEK